jgi:hypothetical protein
LNQHKINKRGLTSFFTLFGFLIMSITGLMLYIVPQGRIAYWVNWEMLGLSKTEWGNIHIISSILFITAGAFHIYFNWRILINYFRDKITKGLKLKRELAVTAIVSLILIIGAIYNIPPISYLLDLNEYIKNQWIVSQDYEPPYGHAEETSFKIFTRKMDIPLADAVQELKANGIVIDNTGLSLLEIAEANKISPMDIYLLIKKYEPIVEIDDDESWTAERVELEFAGTNLGNKTLPAMCEKLDMAPENAHSILLDKGIAVQDDDTFKKVAERLDLNPIDILKALLVEDYYPLSGENK